jgi:hypothetical protein
MFRDFCGIDRMANSPNSGGCREPAVNTAHVHPNYDERARTFPQVADNSSSLERKLRIPTRPGLQFFGADRGLLAVSSNFASIEGEQP